MVFVRMSCRLDKRQSRCTRRFCVRVQSKHWRPYTGSQKVAIENPDTSAIAATAATPQNPTHQQHRHQQATSSTKKRIAMLHQISNQLLLSSLLVLLARVDGFVPLSSAGRHGRSSSTSIYSSDYSRSTGGQQQGQQQQQVRAGENAPQFMSQADESRKVCFTITQEQLWIRIVDERFITRNDDVCSFSVIVPLTLGLFPRPPPSDCCRG
jgi:hypothetical protein